MGNPMHRGKYTNARTLAFRDIKDMNAAWRSVLHLAMHRKYRKGEYVYPGKELLFLERGLVRLMFQDLEGMEKILWFIREGCIFGEVAFFSPIPVGYYGTSMSACSVYGFSQETLKRISKEQPDLLLNLFQSMARKSTILTCQTSSLSLDSLLVRICKFLSQRLVPDSDPLTVHIPMSQREMANLLGVHRVSLYRVMRQQEERGMFSPVTGDNMTILRPHEFYKLAGM